MKGELGMNYISYKHIFEEGKIVKETTRWIHFHNLELLFQYDSNYIQFKTMPSKEEFEEAEDYLKAFHAKTGQNHLKFIFPENEKLMSELLEEIVYKKNYDVGFTELYAINPSQFPLVKNNADIFVREVTEENLEEFMQLEYIQDLEFGIPFADGKTKLYKQNFLNESIVQLLAYYKGQPAGALEIIVAEETAEIDGIFVCEEFQRNGIAAKMQRYVMDRFPDKTVILLADGEDTPKEMYKKQNYVFQGFQYEALKEQF